MAQKKQSSTRGIPRKSATNKAKGRILSPEARAIRKARRKLIRAKKHAAKMKYFALRRERFGGPLDRVRRAAKREPLRARYLARELDLERLREAQKQS